MVSNLLSYTNPVFAGYAFYAALVLLKMFLLAFATSAQRSKKQVFANDEDAAKFGSKHLAKVIFSDPDVERVRRNHLNDLENIPAFLFLGLLYILVEPSTVVALWHFRIFVGSRFLHTIAYQLPLPQPSRALFFIAGITVCFSMAFQILLRTIQ